MKGFELPKSILFVGAHPDDEFLSAILLWQNYERGGKNLFFCATKGEKGKGYVYKLVNEKELAALREQEFYASCSYFGAEKSNERFISDFPDGGLSSLNPVDNELERHIREFLKRTMPHIIVTFGEDGYTRHSDHITINSVVLQIVREMGIPVLVIVPPPQHFCPNFIKDIEAKRRKGIYEQSSVEVIKPNIHIYGPEHIKKGLIERYQSQAGINPRVFSSRKREARFLLRHEFYNLYYFDKVKNKFIQVKA